jgi:hypothetical protein
MEVKGRDPTNRDLLVAPPLVRISVAPLLDNRGLLVAFTGQESVCIGFLVLVLLDRGKDDQLLFREDTDHGEIVVGLAIEARGRYVGRKCAERIKSAGGPGNFALNDGNIVIPAGLADDTARLLNVKVDSIVAFSDGDLSVTCFVGFDLDGHAAKDHFAVAGIGEERRSLAVGNKNDLFASVE